MLHEPRAPRRAPHRRPANESIQTRIGIILCATVLVASVGLVELDARITDAMLALPSDSPAEGHLVPIRRVQRRTRPRLVCLVSIDGLRSDYVIEPRNFARLSAESVCFRTVAAQASHSLVSMKSMLTGKYPTNLLLEETSADSVMLTSLEDPRTFLLDAFRAVSSPLAESFRSAGYRTGIFADGGWILDEAGFSEGFDETQLDATGVRDAFANASNWLAANDGRDAFVLVHSRDLVSQTLSGTTTATDYAERVKRLDASLGALIDELHDQEIWDESLLVLTATHGFSLGERDIVGHGDLYLEQLRVPLIIKPPSHWGLAPGENSEPIELVDLYPTLRAASGALAGESIDGVSFLPILFRGVSGRDYLISQTSWSEGGANAVRRSVLAPGRWQIIHDASNDAVEFFSLERDPRGLTRAEPRGEDVPLFVESLFREASLRVEGDGVRAPSSRVDREEDS